MPKCEDGVGCETGNKQSLTAGLPRNWVPFAASRLPRLGMSCRTGATPAEPRRVKETNENGLPPEKSLLRFRPRGGQAGSFRVPSFPS